MRLGRRVRAGRRRAGDGIVVGHDMRPSSPELVAAFAAGATAQGADVVDDRARLDRPALLRQRQPRPAGRDVHGQPQPGAVQRHQAVPGRRPAGRPGHRPGRDPRPAPSRACPTSTARPGTVDRSRTCCPAYAEYLRTLVDLSGIRRLKVVVDAGNGMGGHTVPTVLGRAAARPRPALLRARRHLPQPRGQPARPGATWSTCRRGCARRAPTSAWPSTATPTAAS